MPTDGSIQTVGGVAVDQRATIGEAVAIDSLSIGIGDTWNAYADITTDNSGGETLNLNTGLTFTGKLYGHANDVLNVGADTNGGVFIANGQVGSVSVNVVSGEFIARSTLGGNVFLSDVSVADGVTLTLI